jgi:hypothetical protein
VGTPEDISFSKYLGINLQMTSKAAPSASTLPNDKKGKKLTLSPSVSVPLHHPFASAQSSPSLSSRH